MKPLHLALTILLSQPWLTQAAAPEYPVAPRVETVRTGGYWEAKEHRGRYRVVVAHDGFEHIQTYIRVEWVLDSAHRDSAELAKYEVVHEALLGSVDVESMDWDQTGTVVTLAGSLEDGSEYRCQLLLRTDGSLDKGSGC